jgi:hypothetical protein
MMTRWWKGVAVAAAWLGLAVMGQAQVGLPSPVGAARMTEPLGYKPSPQPELVPGPLTPAVAPVGPPDCLSLPSTHTSAFQCENYSTESAWYGSLGGIGIARYQPGKLPIAYFDPESARVRAPLPGQPNRTIMTDTGVVTQQTHQVALDLSAMHPDMAAGIRATIGYLFDADGVEVTGFYQPPSNNSRQVIAQNQLLLDFPDGGRVPTGFEGDKGLWRQADLVKLSYQTSVASAEFNYRHWNTAINQLELILGVRYFYTNQRLNILTDDDFLTKNGFGASNPTLAATYAVNTRNNIVGVNMGSEFTQPCPIPCFGWVCFTGVGKVCLGPNIVQTNFNLSRGDGLGGFFVEKSSVNFGQVYELNGCVDLHLLERLRLRLGYMALWTVGTSEPSRQVDFNFSTQGQRKTDQSSSFWHGPIVELQFLW